MTAHSIKLLLHRLFWGLIALLCIGTTLLWILSDTQGGLRFGPSDIDDVELRVVKGHVEFWSIPKPSSSSPGEEEKIAELVASLNNQDLKFVITSHSEDDGKKRYWGGVQIPVNSPTDQLAEIDPDKLPVGYRLLLDALLDPDRCLAANQVLTRWKGLGRDFNAFRVGEYYEFRVVLEGLQLKCTPSDDGPFSNSWSCEAETDPDALPELQRRWAHRLRSPTISIRCTALMIPPSAVGLAGVGLKMMHIRRRRGRQRAGCCPACGYDRRASVDRCPECGFK